MNDDGTINENWAVSTQVWTATKRSKAMVKDLEEQRTIWLTVVPHSHNVGTHATAAIQLLSH